MAGTLFGLPLSQQYDTLGNPARGGLLYIYAANTSTPASTYSDFALGTLQTFPIELDSTGRVPAFWVDDGSYRARLTTSTGVELLDEQSITSIGASSGGSTGSSSSDTTTIFQTGDVLWNGITGTRSGWIRLNGRTIGSCSSSATERANSDTQALFEYFWTNFSNTICAVGGGRGSDATSDFNANKSIAVLDLRGRALFGLDDMGSTAASRITLNTPTAAGTTGGSEGRTISQTYLPNVSLVSSSLTASVATTITNGTGVTRNFSASTNGNMSHGGGFDGLQSESHTSSTISLAGGTVTIAGTVPLGGSGTSLPTMNPYMVGTWYCKL